VKRSGDITQHGMTTIAHSGVGNINVLAKPYVIEEFPAPLQGSVWNGPPSRLLAADMQVVPFDQRREPDLSRLAQWRDRPGTLQVMLVSGPGGQGKTRLVGEFARRCGAAGWAAARARHSSGLKPGTGLVDAGFGSSGRLLVVDYAERWPVDDLQVLFTDSFVTQGLGTRVLLVARPAGRWWQSLRQALSDFGLDPDHSRLSGLAPEPADRWTAFEHARNAFAARLEVSDPERIQPPTSLEDPAFGLALSLHMAALVAVDAYVRGESPPDDPAKLTSYLIRREYLHWERMLRSRQIQTSAPQMAAVTFIATLTRPMPWMPAEEVLTAARLADSAGAARPVLSDHQVCYPAERAGAGTVLEPLYPDRLGEDFVAAHLTGGPSDELDLADGSFDDIPACLLCPTADGRHPFYAGHVMTTLVETARRWPHVANGYLYPLLRDRPDLAFAAGGATLAVLAEQADISVLERLEPGLPDDRHADLDLAAAVITRRLTDHRLATTGDPTVRARLKATLAWRMFNAGLYGEAVTASVDTMQSYRQLAESDPAAFTPELARALYNLSVLLSVLGSHDALAFGFEAVSIYIRLAEADPARFDAELAPALYFLSVLLPDLGRREEALNIAQYAVQVYQRLTKEGRSGLEPDLARTLSGLSGLLSGLGRREEALAAGQQAVRMYRTLADARPGTFEEELAGALREVAGILLQMGSGKEALAAAEEAVPIYRRLGEVSPAALGLGLGKALYQLSELRWAEGQREHALAAMEESVRVLRQGAVAEPVHAYLLWRAHGTLAQLLAEAGRREEAMAAQEQGGQALMQEDPLAYRRVLASEDVLTVADQAVRSYRALAAANPARFMPDLAHSLENLSSILSGRERREEALAATIEAARIDQERATGDPVTFAPRLARTIDEWVALRKLAGEQEALAAAQQTVQLYRALAQNHPAAFALYLLQALRNLSDTLWEARRREEAVAARQKAMQLYRTLPADTPARLAYGFGFLPVYRDDELIHTAEELVPMLSELGRLEEALSVRQEAEHIYRAAAVSNPKVTPALMAALDDTAGILSELGRREEAMAVSQAAKHEAVRIYRQATATNPAVFALDLAKALSEVARFLSEQGRHEEALAPAQEAEQIYRGLAAANPAAFGRDLADRLRVLSIILTELGRQDEALAATREAVEAYRRLVIAHPATFPPGLADALSNLSAGPPDGRRQEAPCVAAERIVQEGILRTRQNGLTFIVALPDWADAAGLAKLLADVRLPEAEAKTAFLVPPVAGSGFLATGRGPGSWYEKNVPPGSAVAYLLDHEPGLSRQIQGIPGTFYVGVPELTSSQEYGTAARVICKVGVLDYATGIMRDYSSPTSLYGVIFEEDEALRMRNLAADFPYELDADNTLTSPFSMADVMTHESQVLARSSYRSPEPPRSSGSS
jgi:tetratricopeptide (TPR) repeat protein